MTTNIYSLRDEFGITRYIGKTIKPLHQRLAQHLLVARNNSHSHHCSNWIRSMIRNKISPTIHLIESVVGDGCESERGWILIMRSMGWPLVNTTNGGEGVVGLRHSDDTKAKWSAARKGKNLGHEVSDETRRKIGLAHKGKKISQQHRQALSRANKGKKISESTKSKLHFAFLGRSFSDSTRAKISDAKRGIIPSLESRMKMKAAKLGRKLTLEHRLNIGKSLKGRRITWNTKPTQQPIPFPPKICV